MKSMLALALSVWAASPSWAMDWRDTATAMVREEKTVVDAMFTQPISLWVSMVDDGSRRDGFASYLCMVLYDAGMEPGDFVIIKILDATAMARQEMIEIGRNECSKN